MVYISVQQGTWSLHPINICKYLYLKSSNIWNTKQCSCDWHLAHACECLLTRRYTSFPSRQAKDPRSLIDISIKQDMVASVWIKQSKRRLPYSRISSRGRPFTAGVESSSIDAELDTDAGNSAMHMLCAISGEVNFWWKLKYCSIAKRRCSSEAESPVGWAMHCWSSVRVEWNCRGVALRGVSATLKSEPKTAATGSKKGTASEHAAASDLRTSSLAEMETAGSAKKILRTGAIMRQKHQAVLWAYN